MAVNSGFESYLSFCLMTLIYLVRLHPAHIHKFRCSTGLGIYSSKPTESEVAVLSSRFVYIAIINHYYNYYVPTQSTAPE